MNIRPIGSDEDYEEALTEIKRLWRSAPGSPGRGRLEVLAMLAHRYERAREPLPALSPIEAIEFRMEQMNLSRRDLLPIFGSAGRTSEILRGKRPLTLDMIRHLHKLLDVPLESLIQETTKRRSRSRATPSVRGLGKKPNLRQSSHASG